MKGHKRGIKDPKWNGEIGIFYWIPDDGMLIISLFRISVEISETPAIH